MQGGSGQSEMIEIYVSCRNLKDLDVFSKSDPYLRVSFSRDYTAQMKPIGKTETIKNNLNPNFLKSFQLEYVFESRQDILFEVFDDDNGNDDFIGSAKTTIGALMGAKCQTSILDLMNQGKSAGKVVVRCEVVPQCNKFLMMKFRAQKLMNTDSFFDFWDKSDPYLKILRIRQDNSLVEVYRTEVVKDNLNPNWNKLQVGVNRVCSQQNPKFKMQCWDQEDDGNDQFIGQCYFTIPQLVADTYPRTIVLSNPKKDNPGNLVLEQFRIFNQPTFSDYLRGGLQLNMSIAIDFTGSNGRPTQPDSLHYINPNAPNQYQMAINAITSILLNYDTDKKIPAFGFGGIPKMVGKVSHCFPLSGNMGNTEALGVQQLMSMYNQALLNVELSGPTYFAPILTEIMKISAMCRDQGSNTYQIFLIITDGQIHDMELTIDLLYDCGMLPLSVIVVGVGNADFANMRKLDGDDGFLFNSKGMKAIRDVVQFVAFREVQMNAEVLARQLLAEVPRQVTDYMRFINKEAGQPRSMQLPQPTNHPIASVYNMAAKS